MTVDYDTGVDWDEVVRDYEGWELTVPEVCERHMLTREELYSFLRAEGVALRGHRRNPALPAKLDRAVHWYSASSVPVRKLCEVAGVRVMDLYGELRRRGVRLRGTYL